ncbi:MAG TPA: protein adenylyltransferase SelO family protein, partial [Roseateles sp.]
MSLLAEDTEAADLGLRWKPGFAALGPAFFTELRPTPLPDPYWVGRSEAVARELGLPTDWHESKATLAALTGSMPVAGARPIATVYSGHQFGVWAGQLGDGRAIMLGETEGGLEVQLKGAGRTPYSRGGDGRAVLRSSIREFLCSEAMHGLGIPTTRALCVTGSDAPV